MDNLKTFSDKRGSLTLLEVGHDIPFQVARAYWLYDVPADEERGKHANKVAYQFLIAINGSMDLCLEDINGKRHLTLDSKSKGILVPPGTWNELSNFSPDGVLLVFSSHLFIPETYLNTHQEFLDYIHKENE